MSRALVTGATGLVGRHIVSALSEQGWSVRSLVRPASIATAPAIGEIVGGDVLDAESFARAAHGCDVIFHAAAQISARSGPAALMRTNVEGTRNAIAAARSARARLLHLSSVAVYGESRFRSDGGPTTEDVALEALPPAAHYARSKRETERMVLDAHRRGEVWAAAIRPAVIYGRHDRQFVPRIARIIRRLFIPVVGTGETIFPVVHVENVAQCCVLAARNDVAGGKAFNAANDFDVAYTEFFRLAARGLEARLRLVHAPIAVANAVASLTEFVAGTILRGRVPIPRHNSIDFLTRDNPYSSERARSLLGWSPTRHPHDAVPDAFAWWRNSSSRRAGVPGYAPKPGDSLLVSRHEATVNDR